METFYTSDRGEWRAYLAEHFETAEEVWFVFPTKDSGEESLSYNDAVEEAPRRVSETAGQLYRKDPSQQADHGVRWNREILSMTVAVVRG